jgi:hypothetical protein
MQLFKQTAVEFSEFAASKLTGMFEYNLYQYREFAGNLSADDSPVAHAFDFTFDAQLATRIEQAGTGQRNASGGGGVVGAVEQVANEKKSPQSSSTQAVGGPTSVKSTLSSSATTGVVHDNEHASLSARLHAVRGVWADVGNKSAPSASGGDTPAGAGGQDSALAQAVVSSIFGVPSASPDRMGVGGAPPPLQVATVRPLPQQQQAIVAPMQQAKLQQQQQQAQNTFPTLLLQSSPAATTYNYAYGDMGAFGMPALAQSPPMPPSFAVGGTPFAQMQQQPPPLPTTSGGGMTLFAHAPQMGQFGGGGANVWGNNSGAIVGNTVYGGPSMFGGSGTLRIDASSQQQHRSHEPTPPSSAPPPPFNISQPPPPLMFGPIGSHRQQAPPPQQV